VARSSDASRLSRWAAMTAGRSASSASSAATAWRRSRLGLALQPVVPAAALDQAGAQLGQLRAARRHRLAGGGEVGQRGLLGLDGGELGRRLAAVVAHRGQLVGERGQPLVGGGGALRRLGLLVARPGQRAEGHLHGAAALGLGRGRGGRRLAALAMGLAAGGELGRQRGDLRLERVEPVALAQPGGGRGRGVRPGDQPVPAPQRALAGDQPLALGQGRRGSLAGGVVGDDADLGQPAGQRRGAADMAAERLGAGRQGRRRRVGGRLGPVHRRAGIGRGGEVLAERRAERGLVAGIDRQGVDQRRPEVGAAVGEDRGQRRRLGGQAVVARLRRLQRLARRGLGGGRRDPRLLGLGGGGLGGGEGLLGRRGGGLRLDQGGIVGRGGGGAAMLGLDLDQPAAEPLQPGLQLAQPAQQGGAAGLGGGEIVGLGGESLLAGGDVGVGGGDRGGRLGGGAGLRRGGSGELGLLGGEPLVGLGGVGRPGALAHRVAVDLRQALAGVALGGGDALLLLLQRVAGQRQALQLGGGLRLGLAQRRHGGGRLGLAGAGGGGDAGALGHRRLGGGERVGGGLLPLRRLQPLQVQQGGVGAADVLVEVAVAVGLAGLLLQRLELALQGDDDVVEPGQVGLGGAQPELGLVAPRMQPGDAGRLLEQGAAVGRLGVDDGTDPALAHQRGGVGAGGGVGEQQLDVAGPRLAAVDPVDRAGAALDAADDLELLMLVERRRHPPLGVVQPQADLGDVAGRAVGAAAEDDVVHLAAAHALGRGLAHHPAQRLDEIGLAAAVRADDPRHPRLDDQLGGVDEGLEAAQPQLGEMDHARASPNMRVTTWAAGL
jgi:hypothetical protein